MTIEELSQEVLERVGGAQNVVSAINCMTRVRITVRNDSAIRDNELRALENVLAVVHDKDCYVEVVLGPGKSRECVEALRKLGVSSNSAGSESGTTDINVGNSSASASNSASTKQGIARRTMKTLGQIFAPLIPGIIVAGLCSGFAAILKQAAPSYADVPTLAIIFSLLSGASATLMTYITAWAGWRTAEVFGGTPILGGMVGMFTTLTNVDDISKLIGLYNDAQPLNAILRAGRGGVLAAVLGVWLMCLIERRVRAHMPSALDVVFSPLITLLATLVPYVFVIMPAAGFVSKLICDLISVVALSTSPAVRMLAGFAGATLFLPMVAAGMHHGLIAIYSVQLDSFGYVTFYPALAMAGAGMVGAAVAIALKAKRTGNKQLVTTINAALPAGLLGIGEPLIYGVALPLGKPFVTAGLGAGFGGAFVMLMEVAATTWGPSGLLGTFVMTEGPHGAVASMGCYLVGWLISVAAGFVITKLMVTDADVAAA